MLFKSEKNPIKNGYFSGALSCPEFWARPWRFKISPTCFLVANSNS